MYFDPNDPGVHAEIERVVAPDRFADYVAVCGGNIQNAARLYVWNSAIASAFWSPLAMTEIAFRNAITIQLTTAYGNTWYDDPTFLSLNAHGALYKSISDAKKRIPGNKPVTPSLVVSRLHFGFWTSLSGKRYARTLWPQLKGAFPKYTRRPAVSGLFDELRVFRNRIAHHQHIYDKSPTLMYDKIQKAAALLSPTLPSWIDHYNRVVQLLSDGPMQHPLRF